MTRSQTSALLAISAALGTLAAAPSTASAQARQDSVLLQGQVVEEETGDPIAFVALTMLDRQGRIIGRAEGDRQGRFSYVARNRAGLGIRVERIGYQDNETPLLWFDGYDFYQVEIRMDREAVLLAPLEITARRSQKSSVLADFEHRSQRGMGWYLTRAEIESRNPSRVTDLLSMAPGVSLSSSGQGLRRVVEMVRNGAQASRCPVQVYLDGMHLNAMNGPWHTQVVAIDDYVAPESVQGIELYRGLSTVPAQFLNEYAKCGVVAVWTRRGRDGRREDGTST